jgi:hypothetical protein
MIPPRDALLGWSEDPAMREFLRNLQYDLVGKNKKAFRQELAKGTMRIDGLWTVVYMPVMRMVYHNDKEILLFPAEVSSLYVRDFSKTVDNELWVSGGYKYWEGHTLHGQKSPKGFQWSIEGDFSFRVRAHGVPMFEAEGFVRVRGSRKEPTFWIKVNGMTVSEMRKILGYE